MILSNCLRGTKRTLFIAITLISVCLIIFINLPTRSNDTELSAYIFTPSNTIPTKPDTTDEEPSSNLEDVENSSTDSVLPSRTLVVTKLPIFNKVTEQIQNKITDAPAIDNMYLKQPSQQWIREQFDKAYRLLGYKKTELKSWMTCTELEHQYYFKNIETVFTGVPKSGNSNWIEALLLADGGLTKTLGAKNVNKVHGVLSHKIRVSWWIKTKGRKWIDSATREAFSFAVVRNPWTRMVSGYRDKLTDEPAHPGTKLTKNIRISIVKEIRGVYDDTLYPTFEEFLFYLIKHKTTSDVHFIPQHQLLCIPQASYDYVIPLEYSNVMQKDVWNHINTSVPLQESYDSVSDPRQQSSALTAKEWFSKIKPEIIEQLYDLYRADFVLMNYSNFSDPNFPLPLHNTEL